MYNVIELSLRIIFYVFLFCIIILILRREITEESLDIHSLLSYIVTVT